MLSFFNDQNHAPEPAPASQCGLFFEGDRVLRFETPARADDRQGPLTARGRTRRHASRHTLHAISIDRRSIQALVCTPRDLAFPEHGWRDWLTVESGNNKGQPFSSAWPVRTLRQAGCAAVFFCSRPPGQHAGPDAMGICCFLNNTAAFHAAQTLHEGGAAKAAMPDVDINHENGTHRMCCEQADVLFVGLAEDSMREHPLIPGPAEKVHFCAQNGFYLDARLATRCGAGLWFEVLEIVCARIAIDGAEVLAVYSGQDTVANNFTSRFAPLARNFSLVGGRSAQLGLPNVFEPESGYAADGLVANADNLIEGFEGG